MPGGDAGTNIEALSSVARTLNFRLTVRDNAVYRSTAPVSVGQTHFTDMAVTVSAASGPFSVTAPNTAVSWAGGSSQTITWAVASTTAAPVSCANVKISLSTDGGQTFPTVLAASTPNDGSEVLTIPNTATTTARVKIEAIGNIFFDISNTNFTITSGAVCGAPAGLTASAITTSGATLGWTAVSGAAGYDVDYKLTTSGTWTNAATATTATSVSVSGLSASTTYDWRVRTNCASSSSAYTASQFTTASVTPACETAFEPNETQATAAAIASGVTNSAAISSTTDIDYFKITTTAASDLVFNLVGPAGVDYDLYIYNSAGTQIGIGESSTATETVTLNNQAAGTYYIKVVGYNGANSATCYTIKATATTVSSCQSSLDNGTNGTTSGAATIPFNTNVKGLISPSGDVDNYKFVITTGGTITVSLTTLPKDYDLKILNSAGTKVAISQNTGTTSETINYTAAAGTYYAQVYGYNGANSATGCYTLKVQLGTASRSIAVGNQPILSIYPNPVHNQLTIRTGSYTEPVVVLVTDMYGRRLISKTITGTAGIPTATLAAGVYLVTISDKNGTVIRQEKIVKE